jgi:hypothetical protein
MDLDLIEVPHFPITRALSLIFEAYQGGAGIYACGKARLNRRL